MSFRDRLADIARRLGKTVGRQSNCLHVLQVWEERRDPDHPERKRFAPYYVRCTEDHTRRDFLASNYLGEGVSLHRGGGRSWA